MKCRLACCACCACCGLLYSTVIATAAADAWTRLIHPSLSNQIRRELTQVGAAVWAAMTPLLRLVLPTSVTTKLRCLLCTLSAMDSKRADKPSGCVFRMPSNCCALRSCLFQCLVWTLGIATAASSP